MKIVVIGGSGLIGSKLVSDLRSRGHEVLAASPDSGVNTITDEGLAEALVDTQVVVDVSNSPSFEDKAVMEFFQTSGRNLIAAETMNVITACPSQQRRRVSARRGTVSEDALSTRSCAKPLLLTPRRRRVPISYTTRRWAGIRPKRRSDSVTRSPTPHHAANAPIRANILRGEQS